MDEPSADMLATRLARVLGTSAVSELGEGHQSRVFRVEDPVGVARSAGVVIAKVTDARLAARAELEVRAELAEALADLGAGACRPLRVGGRLVTEIESGDGADAGLLVCFEPAEGRPLDVADADDATRMGRAVRALHRAMRSLPPLALPPMRAFQTAPPAVLDGLGATQLLHGDINSGNMRLGDDGIVRIFDFDDCGYGPPVLDVANAIYMVMFDALVDGQPERADRFRTAFLAGHRDPSDPSTEIDELAVDRLLDVRVEVLAGWLDDLATAPIGVRTSSASWQATLRSVVARHRAGAVGR